MERESHHVVLVLDIMLPENEVINAINDIIVERGVRRVVIHVLSSEGRPKYLEKLRRILPSLLNVSVMVKYAGSSQEDLVKLLGNLPKDAVDVLVGSTSLELDTLLEGLGVSHRFL